LKEEQKMHEYDFISTSITEAQVKNIITKSGYNPASYSYSPRVDRDGFLVRGNTAMALAPLRNAARALKIRVEITSPAGAGALTNGSARLNEGAGVDETAGSPYKVNLTMSQGTVQALQNGNYALYGFKAVQSTMGGGAPLVWFSIPAASLLTTVAVEWTEQYQAYISNTFPAASGTTVVASADVDISLGEQWNVAAGGGTNVTTEGPSIAISINNTTTTPFTCGVSMEQNGEFSPLCAFPLYGGGLDIIAPIEKVVLMFATTQLNTGTVIEQAFSPGVFIDLTGDNQRSVTYDINQGWSWGGGSWGQQVPASASLIPFLIEPPSSHLLASVRESAFGRQTATKSAPAAQHPQNLTPQFASLHAESVSQN
jgi:hypothetical protein